LLLALLGNYELTEKLRLLDFELTLCLETYHSKPGCFGVKKTDLDKVVVLKRFFYLKFGDLLHRGKKPLAYCEWHVELALQSVLITADCTVL